MSVNTLQRIIGRCTSVIGMCKDMGEIRTRWMGEHTVGGEETRWERRRATIGTAGL
jgi:hypothetical protein